LNGNDTNWTQYPNNSLSSAYASYLQCKGVASSMLGT